MVGALTGAAVVIQEDFPEKFGQFGKEFAKIILITTAAVVTCTYRISAWNATAAFKIALAAVESVHFAKYSH